MDELTVMIAGVFGSAVLIVFIIARYNYLVKKAMIEKGDGSINNIKQYSFMDVGSIVLSIGAGLGISSIFTELNLREETMYLLIYATNFICGGIGLIIAHYFRKRG